MTVPGHDIDRIGRLRSALMAAESSKLCLTVCAPAPVAQAALWCDREF